MSLAVQFPVQSYALLVATATFLFLPYAFNYDMTVPMIGALTVMSARLSKADGRLGFYGFIAPQVGMILAAMGAPLMPLMIAGLAVAQFRLCRAEAGGAMVPPPTSTGLGLDSRRVPASR
jgi:hypothetical protein